jgi:hypothetical protein
MAAPFFGSLALTPDGNQRFTQEWERHDIRFLGEVVDYKEVPYVLAAAGYGPNARFDIVGRDPGFLAPTIPDPEGHHLRLASDSVCHRRCSEAQILAPDGSELVLPGGRDAGAWQGDVMFDLLSPS